MLGTARFHIPPALSLRTETSLGWQLESPTSILTCVHVAGQFQKHRDTASSLRETRPFTRLSGLSSRGHSLLSACSDRQNNERRLETTFILGLSPLSPGKAGHYRAPPARRARSNLCSQAHSRGHPGCEVGAVTQGTNRQVTAAYRHASGTRLAVQTAFLKPLVYRMESKRALGSSLGDKLLWGLRCIWRVIIATAVLQFTQHAC